MVIYELKLSLASSSSYNKHLLKDSLRIILDINPFPSGLLDNFKLLVNFWPNRIELLVFIPHIVAGNELAPQVRSVKLAIYLFFIYV